MPGPTFQNVILTLNRYWAEQGCARAIPSASSGQALRFAQEDVRARDAGQRERDVFRDRGWGHGDWAQCARFADACSAGRLWLFHHKPGRTDRELTAVRTHARRVFAGTEMAREGATFEV